MILCIVQVGPYSLANIVLTIERYVQAMFLFYLAANLNRAT